MGCKACEKDAENVYRAIAKSTGICYYSFRSDKGNLMYIPETMLDSLPEGTQVTKL